MSIKTIIAGRTRTIICTLANREEVPADLVGTDPLSDIAILKLHPSKPRTFPAAHFGDSSALKVGQRVLALYRQMEAEASAAAEAGWRDLSPFLKKPAARASRKKSD